jgi:hypothetical protein
MFCNSSVGSEESRCEMGMGLLACIRTMPCSLPLTSTPESFRGIPISGSGDDSAGGEAFRIGLPRGGYLCAKGQRMGSIFGDRVLTRRPILHKRSRTMDPMLRRWIGTVTRR